MVWSEIVEQKRTGRVGKDGRRRARTKFRVRVCWPGADRITKMDVLAFGRRAEAEVRARTLLAMVEAHDAGQGPDPFIKPDGLDFATLLEGYKAALAAGGLGHKRRKGKPKPKHVKGSASKLSFVATSLQLRNLADFARVVPEIDVRLEELQRLRGWNDKTRDMHAQVLRQFGRWLVLRHRWPRNLFADVKFVATDASVSGERRALSNEQAEKLIQAASVRPVAEFRRTHPNARPEVLEKLEQAGWVRGTYYLLAIECGWRRQEMQGTTWADLRLDDDKPCIRVRASTEGNKGAKESWLLLPDVVAARLREHRARLRKHGPVALTDRVLPVPSHLVEHLRKDAAYAGLGKVERTNTKTPAGNYSRTTRWVDPEGDFVKLDVHALRTTFGTKVVRNVDITVGHLILRHRNITTTIKHYARLARPAMVEAEMAKIPRVSACVLNDVAGAPQVGAGVEQRLEEPRQAHG